MTDRRLHLWLRIVYGFFVLQGLSWLIIGSFDPLGVWDRLAALNLFADAATSGELPPDASTMKRFMLGPLAGTNSAFWLLCLFVEEVPLRRGEPWALRALAAGLVCWFVIDSSASVAHGGLFNVLLVNLPCLFLAGTPLLLLFRSELRQRKTFRIT